jgi:2Fe-2S ferredoxin
MHEYRSLMHLIQDKIYIDDFGECRGMGKCATCLIEITNCVGNKIYNFDRNEKETLRKAGVTDVSKRLSCQIVVDENINGIKLKI